MVYDQFYLHFIALAQACPIEAAHKTNKCSYDHVHYQELQ